MPESVQFKLNLPADVKAWLAEQATRNLRSQSAEIVATLRERMRNTDQHLRAIYPPTDRQEAES